MTRRSVASLAVAEPNQLVKRSYRTSRLPALVGTEEVAKLLGVNRGTVHRWIEPGSDPDATRQVLATLRDAGVISEATFERCVPARGKRHRAAARQLILDLWKSDREAGRMLAACTLMIPPVTVGGGAEYAAALRTMSEALRDGAEDQDADRAEQMIEQADQLLVEAAAALEFGAGRPMWVLSDVLRYGGDVQRREPFPRRPQKSSA